MADSSRIVFVNGCFDLLHVGHVSLIEYAGQFGRVTVGLNSDASVRQLKGPSRPIIGQIDRWRMLLAMKSVREVFLFDEPTPIGLIRWLRPDIYVVGPDHSTDCELCDFVRGYGGRVIQAPEYCCQRTSEIIQRLQQCPTHG